MCVILSYESTRQNFNIYNYKTIRFMNDNNNNLIAWVTVKLINLYSVTYINIDSNLQCCVWNFRLEPSKLLNFFFYWSGWWSGLWVGRGGRYAVGPFWWKAVQGSSRSAIYFPSVPQSHYLSLQVTGGEASPGGSGFLWWHWPIGYVSSFFEEYSWGPGPSSHCGISAAPSFG